MDIETLRNANLSDFYDYGIIISKFNRFPDYYLDYLDNRGICLYYTQYQEFLWAIKDSRFRYLDIEMEDGDSVCVMYKCIFYAKRLKMYDMPVSKNNNIDNVRRVLYELLSKKFVSSFVVDEERILSCIPYIDIDKVERNYMSDNFYSSLDFVEGRLSNAFRSKYGVNRLEKNLRYEFINRSLSIEEIERAENIYKEWAEKSRETPGEFREFKNILRYSSSNIVYLFSYYEDDPVSISIILNCGKFFIEEFCYTKTRSDFSDKKKKKALNKIVLYVKYLELKYMKDNYGVDVIYVLGSGHKSKDHGLYMNKEENNEGFVKYYELRQEDIKDVSRG